MMNSNELRGYLLGVGTALTIVVIIAFFVLDISFKEKLANNSKNNSDLLVPPSQEVLSEISAKGGVFDNANGLSTERGHETILVHEDQTLSYALNKSVSLDTYLLRPNAKFNLDPPVLYLNSKEKYSSAVQAYLSSESLGKTSISTDKHGYRTTLPQVENSKKILLVGDSVTFGVGVDDEDTIASQLQAKIGEGIQIVNAGVGGYNTDKNIKVVKAHANAGFKGLIYIICENDISSLDDVNDIIVSLRTYKENYGDSISVVLHSYLEVAGGELIRPKRTKNKKIRLRRKQSTIAEVAEKNDVKILFWSDLATEYQKKMKSVFAVMGLYVDHCHFSKTGNRLVAEGLLDFDLNMKPTISSSGRVHEN